MPLVRIKYAPPKGYDEIVDSFVREIPGIVAPQMNILERKLHDGGVGVREILVECFEFSPRDRNVDGIQITVIAHPFEERCGRREKITKAITKDVGKVLSDFDRNARVSVYVWLVEMEYARI